MRLAHVALVFAMAFGCSKSPMQTPGSGGRPAAGSLDGGIANGTGGMARLGGTGGISGAQTGGATGGPVTLPVGDGGVFGVGGSGGAPSTGRGGSGGILGFGGNAGFATTAGGATGGSATKPGFGGSTGPSVGGSIGTATLSVTPNNVNLGLIDVGAGGVGTVTVTNTGKATSGPITVTPSTGITATGCVGSLAAGAACTITIVAKPPSIAPFTGTVTISASPDAVTPLIVSVIGISTDLDFFSVWPSTIDLGNVAIGVAAPRQVITVTAARAISDLTIAANGADVSIDKPASTCTAVLAAGASCTVVVNFVATTAGAKTDSIVITGGGPSGEIITIPITAMAQAPAKLVISPSNTQNFISVGDIVSTPITFGIANTGDVPTGAISVAVTGADAADFAIASNICLVLAPFASCTFQVTFKPGASDAGATRNAKLSVVDSGVGASSVSVPLTGTFEPRAIITITPASADLGLVPIGTTGPATAFTLQNLSDYTSGALTLALSSSEFVVTDDTCTAVALAKNAACTFGVALKPVAVGAKSAVFTVAGTNSSLASRTMTGTAVPAAPYAADPSALDFGSVTVGTTSEPRTVTIQNQGGSNTGALTVTKAGSATAFPISDNTCTSPLSPGASCTFKISFSPTAARSEKATFALSDATISWIVTLSGTGVP